MYTLFITNKNYSSWSLRPWILMRALSIPFEERLVPLPEGSCWETFRAFAPNGRVPCLHDGEKVVWDSLAIVEYLAERHAGVWPEDPDARAWARCVSSEMHSGFSALRGQCSMTCGVRVRLNGIGEPLRADIARIDEIWAEGRSRFGGPCLAGSAFTAADAFFAPVVFRAQSYGFSLSEAAAAYAEFLLGHPAMQEWYEAALAEPWRDAAHEAEITAAGTVLADFRLGTP
jgi:glutathione S-transferase